ncbi:MAG: hypothetical protein ABJI69_05260 [Balneola sp.]
MKIERDKILIDESIAYKWKDYPTKSAIIFVHGLGGEPSETWGLFPQLLMGTSIGHNFDLISYGYSSKIFLARSPEINSLISEFYSFCNSELSQYDSIIFISHSLGSLLVNGSLIIAEKQNIDLRKYLTHIMITPAFFGGKWYAKFSLSKTARQLSPKNKTLEKVQSDWANSSIKNTIASYQIFGTKDKIVGKNESINNSYSFQTHRIDKNHIDSPKIYDIDSPLFRGVLLVLKNSLQFNSSDSRKYFVNAILRTTKTDWDYDSNKEKWVLLSDFRFSISEVEREDFSGNCSFNANFPNSHSAWQCTYSFRYNDISIHEFILWEIDDGRYLIPAPYIVNGSNIIYLDDYRIAKILEAGGFYQNLDQGLSIANISVDHSKNSI